MPTQKFYIFILALLLGRPDFHFDETATQTVAASGTLHQAHQHVESNQDDSAIQSVDRQNSAATVSGFVDAGAIVFKDVTASAGLAGWHHTMGTIEKRYILEANGSGVALLDFDNDGWLDIYLVNGSTLSAQRGKTAAPHAALFHNNHDGTFTDVATTAGVTNDRWGVGAAIGDYDNDGWPDIYVSNYGGNRLSQ